MSTMTLGTHTQEGATGSLLYVAPVTAVITALAITITFTVAAYVYGGSPLGVTALASSAIALAGWLRSTHGNATGDGPAFNLLVATIVALLLYHAEQWATAFPQVLIRSFPSAYPPGVGLSDHAYVACFALASMAMLVLGALAYFHRLPIGDFAAWFAFSWALGLGLLAYVVGLMGSGGPHYVGGMAMGLPLACLGVGGMRRAAK